MVDSTLTMVGLTLTAVDSTLTTVDSTLTMVDSTLTMVELTLTAVDSTLTRVDSTLMVDSTLTMVEGQCARYEYKYCNPNALSTIVLYVLYVLYGLPRQSSSRTPYASSTRQPKWRKSGSSTASPTPRKRHSGKTRLEFHVGTQ